MRTNDSSMQDREIVLTRTVRAPRALVFQAWTQPQRLARWWGPNGFTITTHRFEFHPGGVWQFIMHGPDGQDYANKIVYDEIALPERLVYTHGDPGEAVDSFKRP